MSVQNFLKHYHQLMVRRAKAKLCSSASARSTLQQMGKERLAAEEQHATAHASQERNIWLASQSRAAELAQRINTADIFRERTEGFRSFAQFGNHMSRTKDALLNRK
jgi:hypothetical protein